MSVDPLTFLPIRFTELGNCAAQPWDAHLPEDIMGGFDRGAWKAEADKVKTGGIFVRLKDEDDRLVCAVLGELGKKERHYNEKTRKYEAYTEEHRKAGIFPTVNYKVNVKVYSLVQGGKEIKISPEHAIKIYEFNGNTLKAFVDVAETFDPGKNMFRFTRQGSGKGAFDNPVPGAPIDANEQAALAQAKLHPLGSPSDDEDGDDESTDMRSHDKAKTNGANGHTTQTAPQQSLPQQAPTPQAAPPQKISEADAELIRNRFKGLSPAAVAAPFTIDGEVYTDPRQKMIAFLKHFGVSKVSDFPALEIKKGMALLAEIEAAGGPPAAPPPAAPTDDPFA
jgi:hypothetical protein